jgi:hypothetical protein
VTDSRLIAKGGESVHAFILFGTRGAGAVSNLFVAVVLQKHNELHLLVA